MYPRPLFRSPGTAVSKSHKVDWLCSAMFPVGLLETKDDTTPLLKIIVKENLIKVIGRFYITTLSGAVLACILRGCLLGPGTYNKLFYKSIGNKYAYEAEKLKS